MSVRHARTIYAVVDPGGLVLECHNRRAQAEARAIELGLRHAVQLVILYEV